MRGLDRGGGCATEEAGTQKENRVWSWRAYFLRGKGEEGGERQTSAFSVTDFLFLFFDFCAFPCAASQNVPSAFSHQFLVSPKNYFRNTRKQRSTINEDRSCEAAPAAANSHSRHRKMIKGLLVDTRRHQRKWNTGKVASY